MRPGAQDELPCVLHTVCTIKLQVNYKIAVLLI